MIIFDFVSKKYQGAGAEIGRHRQCPPAARALWTAVGAISEGPTTGASFATSIKSLSFFRYYINPRFAHVSDHYGNNYNLS